MNLKCSAIALVLWTLFGSFPALAQESGSAIGVWLGSLDYVQANGVGRHLKFGFNLAKKDNGEIAGSVSAYQIGLDAPVEKASVAGGRVAFEFSFLGDRVRFSGALAGDEIKGALTTANGTEPVIVERLSPEIDRDFLVKHAGVYELDDGRRAVLAASNRRFAVYDLKTFEFRNYFPRNAHDFIAGPGGNLAAPVEKRMSVFTEDGADKIRLAAKSGAEHVGVRSKRIVQEEISFKNGDVTLAGYLIRPAQAVGPAPGVVVVWGSGREDRFGFGGMIYMRACWLAQHGFAALVYDKRGVGASGGSYDDRTNEEMAADMAAAVDYLAARPEVDAARVGLFVHSQSGIYAPLTAKMTNHVSFIVDLASSVVNAEIQEIVRTRNMLTADGWPHEDVTAAVAMQILKFFYARERIGWDAYVEAYGRVKDKPWFESIIGSSIDKDDSAWDFWKNINAYEPAADWANVAAPVFYLTGDKDTISPIDEDIALMRGAFAGDRSGLLTLKTYSGANHDLFEAEDGGLLEEAEETRVKPYLGDVLAWLKDIGVAAP